MFNGHNHAYWKYQMHTFLWSLGDHVLFLIERDWMYPIKTLADNTIIPKPMVEWTKEENKESKWNSKVL